jgi:hypothetical protein
MRQEIKTDATSYKYIPVTEKDFFYGILELTADFARSESILQHAIHEYYRIYEKKLSAKKAKKRLRELATAQLRENMEEAGRKRHERTSPHHIVAFDSPRAEVARRLLAQVGIKINAEVNGVYLPMTRKDIPHTKMPLAYPHKIVHTEIYYLNITSLLREAEGDREGTEEILREIAEELTDGTFPIYDELV